ncbi:hypothetical protein [Ehrlichia canis]|uniref:Uncharacterized protein n=1 Tax=Ehrlichia canis (strain Jake) TaxID=269484 RepID=A0ACA6AWT7_EHRCJ|nr:hypothetical protein [Ehrlichia canis]AAZ68786.1 hypothetical protein Ecaj_0754 [Ehrlichia canis str. Jake]AUO54486.1 hypothetical protein C1I72_01025 [Ehrlichia canis]UKC53413.1 hypothetical protein s20019040002_000456 [Ehrlichia canis]UKC54349.1 hypothetical protein s20026770001_000455 [Ehrlichia canis]UKC55285.1 hypothetical protein s21009500007_000455 [Ehrlichia canis]
MSNITTHNESTIALFLLLILLLFISIFGLAVYISMSTNASTQIGLLCGASAIMLILVVATVYYLRLGGEVSAACKSVMQEVEEKLDGQLIGCDSKGVRALLGASLAIDYIVSEFENFKKICSDSDEKRDRIVNMERTLSDGKMLAYMAGIYQTRELSKDEQQVLVRLKRSHYHRRQDSLRQLSLDMVGRCLREIISMLEVPRFTLKDCFKQEKISLGRIMVAYNIFYDHMSCIGEMVRSKSLKMVIDESAQSVKFDVVESVVPSLRYSI